MKRIVITDHSSPKATSRAIFDSTTYNKIQRHLTDPNDVITDEDIRNIRIDVVSTSGEARQHSHWHKGSKN